MTMNTSWGYKWYDNNWKSGENLIQMLVDIASKGGNLLLNVGPTAEGVIPDSSVVRLKQIGNWLKINGESVYGTSASPFFRLDWGRCTQKKENGKTTFYLHVFDWPNDQILKLPGLKARIQDVYLLANPDQKFAWKFEDGDMLIHIPSVIFDPINTVIVVKTKDDPEVVSNMPSLKDGRIVLPAKFADIHNPGYGNHARLIMEKGEGKITDWSDSRTRVEWMFNCSEKGNFGIYAWINASERSKLKITIGDKSAEALIQPGSAVNEKVMLGEIEVNGPGDFVIAFNPVKEEWKGVELVQVELVKK
jgi:alpha-L-fucosidase